MRVEQCTRRMEFDAAHRVHQHGGKCRTLHGHRYAVEVTCQAEQKTAEGFIVDFAIVKRLVGGWIDEVLDHTTILYEDDPLALPLTQLFESLEMPRKLVLANGDPTAEWFARHLFAKASDLLNDYRLEVVKVRVYETPNCWADCIGDDDEEDEEIGESLFDKELRLSRTPRDERGGS